MRTLNYFLLFLLCLAVLLTHGGCKNKLALDAEGNPNVLVIGVYEGDNIAEQTVVLEKVRQYLQKKLDRKVEIQVSSDYTSVVEALLTNKVHMAYISPFSYVLATQKQRLVLVVVPGLNGKPMNYRSILFTNPATGLKTMDDVKAKAKSLTLCFADPASTSGHLVPRAYLTSIGLDPKTGFKETMFAGSHFASMLAVKGGKVDVGCSWEFGYDKMIRNKMIRPEDLVILWRSDPIVESPIVMRPDINAQFTGRVRDAYLNMPTEAPAVFKAYISMYDPGRAGSIRYIRVDDSVYNGLRKIAAGIDILLPAKKSN
jgi:phosphonate transport system substrate-binding protein